MQMFMYTCCSSDQMKYPIYTIFCVNQAALLHINTHSGKTFFSFQKKVSGCGYWCNKTNKFISRYDAFFHPKTGLKHLLINNLSAELQKSIVTANSKLRCGGCRWFDDHSSRTRNRRWVLQVLLQLQLRCVKDLMTRMWLFLKRHQHYYVTILSYYTLAVS